jgi:hypothetical protein
MARELCLVNLANGLILFLHQNLHRPALARHTQYLLKIDTTFSISHFSEITTLAPKPPLLLLPMQIRCLTLLPLILHRLDRFPPKKTTRILLQHVSPHSPKLHP